MHPSVSKFAATLTGALLTVLLSVLYGCGRGGGGCDGPQLPVAQLESLRKQVQAGAGPKAALILPNPIDATNSTAVQGGSSGLQSVTSALNLMDLISPNRLENAFVRVRIKSIEDSAGTLAAPNAQGNYQFGVLDPHYSETMAYYSIQAMIKYVETLGFSVVKSRPLFVLVRAQSDDPQEVNAFYDHNYFSPSSPRMLRVFGETQYPLGADRDIYWHEFGHLFNESASHEVGMDYAADAGASFTEGSALHECLADMLAMSVSNRGYIGRWIARNFNDVPAGQPLRSAVDGNGATPLSFKNIINGSNGAGPERYVVAEWCSRVLWDVRKKFVSENPESGAFQFERLVWSAVGLLKRDTSIRQFHDSLLQADEQLHCGGHDDSIKQAFQSRGFEAEAESLSKPLTADIRPIGISDASGTAQFVTPAPGTTVVFDARIQNTSGVIARNVRMIVEPVERGIQPIVYMQSFGDISPGKTIGIGAGGSLDYSSSVKFEIERGLGSGRKLRYRIKFVPENGPETVLDRELTL